MIYDDATDGTVDNIKANDYEPRGRRNGGGKCGGVTRETTGLGIRSFSAKSKEKKWKKKTPAISKVKKIKIKGYSSFKGRFRTMNDGTIRRWREGKRHNAHLK
ncbi:hypothetical protein AKJ16_DCAP25124, partial [Drosera capensis]